MVPNAPAWKRADAVVCRYVARTVPVLGNGKGIPQCHFMPNTSRPFYKGRSVSPWPMTTYTARPEDVYCKS